MFFHSFFSYQSIQGVVFSAQNGASLTISDNASVNFNGMKLSPSSDLTITDNIVELSIHRYQGLFLQPQEFIVLITIFHSQEILKFIMMIVLKN